MTDQLNEQPARQPDPVPAPPAEAITTDTPPGHMIPKTRFDEVNTELKAVKAMLAKLQKAEEERQEADALAKGDHEKIIAALKPQAERAKALEATLGEYLAAELADIPEDMRGLVPEGDVAAQLKWVKAAKGQGLFGSRPAPATDAGARGDSSGRPVQLTALERQMARAAGMSEQEYAKYKAAGQQQRETTTLPDTLR